MIGYEIRFVSEKYKDKVPLLPPPPGGNGDDDEMDDGEDEEESDDDMDRNHKRRHGKQTKEDKNFLALGSGGTGGSAQTISASNRRAQLMISNSGPQISKKVGIIQNQTLSSGDPDGQGAPKGMSGCGGSMLHKDSSRTGGADLIMEGLALKMWPMGGPEKESTDIVEQVLVIQGLVDSEEQIY
jgi:hypothetical protein